MSEHEYSFEKVESKWQEYWRANGTFRVKEETEKEKFYLLEMYPYPSGEGLHMGQTRVYSIGDVIAKYQRLKGKCVMKPMGFDSFGLPAENAAIERNIHPNEWTTQNIVKMRSQMEKLGLAYDWDRQVITSDPDYYKWTQYLFLKFFENDLAFKKKTWVNYCPSCKTTLANEQVMADGSCERCHGQVIKKDMSQWFFRITKYVEELLEYHEKLTGWPEPVKILQRNWIGKSYGTSIKFPIVGRDETLDVFTTRPDTIYGVTYMVLAVEHPLVDELMEQKKVDDDFVKFVNETRMKKEFERTSEDSPKVGKVTPLKCVNPMTGEEIPILIANYVLMEYGSGAVMAVPAHDQRDFMFSKEYDLPIQVVIQPEGENLTSENLNVDTMEHAYEDVGVMVNSGEFDGMNSKDFIAKVTDVMEEKGIGERQVNYRLRDWGISRQRYWGAPIPIVYCDKCGTVGEKYENLPVLLPEKVDFTAGELSPLATSEEFVNCKCPKCGGDARRETETLDTFVCSSWYYLRYCDPHNKEIPFSKEKVDYWTPVDQYIGGIEHAIMHLMYFRFFGKALRDMGLVSFDEPTYNLLAQGMVTWGGIKMSKSKGNTADPMDIINKFGADATRLFILFAAPPEADIDWDDHIEWVEGKNLDNSPSPVFGKDYHAKNVDGLYRFIMRIWRLACSRESELKSHSDSMNLVKIEIKNDELSQKVHAAIKEVDLDIGKRKRMNTAISRLMEITNTLYAFDKKELANGSEDMKRDFAIAFGVLVRMLSPFAPHIAEEVWELTGHKESIFDVPFPEYDEKVLSARKATMVIQVNGKVRDTVQVEPSIDEDGMLAVAKTEKVVKHFGGKEPVKTIVRPPSLVNFVVPKK
ncbi:leucine--tRNA ligase [bacterium]|nr:leucine--tRNA ligase [bacterium]